MDKIIFSEDSWHYKLNDSLYSYPKGYSLCVYFWRTLFAAVTLIALGAILGAFAALMLSVFFQDIVLGHPVALFLGTALWVILLLVVRAGMLEDLRLNERQGRKRPWWGKVLFNISLPAFRAKKHNKHTSLIWAWVKAKKRKVCPLIGWEKANKGKD